MEFASDEFIASLQHKYLVGYDVADDGTLIVIFFDDELEATGILTQQDVAHALVALGQAFEKDPPSFADTNAMRVWMAYEQWKQSAQVEMCLLPERDGREWKGLKGMIGREPGTVH